MAWQDFAVTTLGSGETTAARERLKERDRAWEADFSLVPDREATTELIALSRSIFFSPGWSRKAPDSMERMNRLIELQDRVIESAQRKRRELA